MDACLVRADAPALVTWARRCIRCFAPFPEQERRVLPLVVISCRRRFPDLPVPTIRGTVKNVWNSYLHKSGKGPK